ncbi:hypothetical protein CTI12_AA447140 [Artemisia annua]|uniref:Replication protein A 70 kDa DNA-binding subunit B/D first OB fold domain-containing protein n=1 Tax=Artemisia annua TaxID=35608 RepID=A0A2U1LW18_ARTAN|nr:hypothetical protein CTI12_AA447140 [Artemisia annua]
MRTKGKAVSNNSASGIPVEGTHLLVCDGGVTNENTSIISDSGFPGSTTDDYHTNAICKVASLSDIGGTSSQTSRGYSVVDGFPGSTLASQPIIHHCPQPAVTIASDAFPANRHHLAVSAGRPSTSETFVPVQIPTVDGYVATFVTSNNAPVPPLTAEQSMPVEATTRFHDNDTSHNVPIILDFSRPDVLRSHHAASCSYNTGTSDSQTRASTRRRNHARNIQWRTGPANRRPTWTGRSHMMDSNVLPVYGPPAPPEREGAPLDYVSFGRCDKVCQHCNALFWVEEKMAGLPMSAAPQIVLREEVIDGLIQFLNENNALVRLFRTARDKLLEANIPNFQIRLFGVAGASQYELPTADTIGAIVYEGGPQSMTDYDIRQYPTSVGASTSPGAASLGKMELTSDKDTLSKIAAPIIPQRSLAYLSELDPTDNNRFIETRVYRKWTTMKAPNFIPTEFSCILLDKKGTAIQANVDLKEKERLEHDLQTNCVYRIQGFGFEKTDSWGKTLDNDITLCFGKHSQIDLLNDDSYPYHYFNFAAYNELGNRLEKNNLILTDWEQEETRNRVPLATLLQIDPNTQQNVMILRIDNTQDWYYQKCDECGGKLRHRFVHGHCHPYGTQPKPEKSYSFRLVITDGTGNATITCFTPHTEGLIKDVNTLLEEVAEKNPQVIPPQIMALVNTRHVLQFRFAKPISKGPPTFVLQKMMDHPPSHLLTQSEGPSSPPATIMGAQTAAEVSPPPATPSATQDTPVGTSGTPYLESLSNVRKELFPDSADEEDNQKPKKQKKD